jgi:hypothetical protein
MRQIRVGLYLAFTTSPGASATLSIGPIHRLRYGWRKVNLRPIAPR